MRSTDSPPRIGFLGLGQMGGPMARNLAAAGYDVTAFDPVPEKLAACVEAGAKGTASAAETVRAGEVVMTSLRSSAMFVEVAEAEILPNVSEGQAVIDMGMTEGGETRRIAADLTMKGVGFLDAPVSGSAASGRLRIFVGGEADLFERCRPILNVIGDPERVVHCGPVGTGQVVKAVNQLAMGLVGAAYLEAVAFGARAGASLEAIRQGVGDEEGTGFRRRVAEVARMVIEERADECLVKFPELPYFLHEAHELGFALPMTRALFEFLDAGPRERVDNMGRPRVAYWHELMRRGPEDA
ncbi:MAG: NAD(P)-dependent oxidoreductase [Planctomycetota bacterium]|jgi:3-hydroxyisobutyrate dehydrogenase-like beta-hydroxyacid dehydrogenase